MNIWCFVLIVPRGTKLHFFYSPSMSSFIMSLYQGVYGMCGVYSIPLVKPQQQQGTQEGPLYEQTNLPTIGHKTNWFYLLKLVSFPCKTNHYLFPFLTNRLIYDFTKLTSNTVIHVHSKNCIFNDYCMDLISCHLSKDNINVKIVTILMMLGLDMDWCWMVKQR